MKVADLDLDKCINACRASELSNERNRAIEATSETVHHLTSGNKREEKKDKRDQGGRDDKDANRKLIPKCKFCGRQHRRGNCPAYGVECKTPGKVIARSYTPRSYVIQTPCSVMRRNRRHLRRVTSPNRVGV